METHNLLKKILPTLLIISLISHSSASLSTNLRWIVNSSGDRVKLRCVNWAGHIHAMIPEGLNKQPLNNIAKKVQSLGFNCVRLTWAIHMYSLEKNKDLTVEQSLNSWNLYDAINGVQANNPNLLNMTVADAQKAVVDALGANNVYVILDNHVSLPMWCCANDDGNGFFGDNFFDPENWLGGLGTVARRYKDNPAVIGMSMRNELRGPKQNVDTWYKYMQQGAEVIHENSPDSLVIVSGFNFDMKLDFLRERAFKVSFKNKIVFESHWYSFGESLDTWKHQTNGFCGNRTRDFFSNSAFVLAGDADSNSHPLFLSEFGLDLWQGIEKEDYYITCLLAFVAENDIDWALWALQGSYMLREGNLDVDETYGLLTKDWGGVRNAAILQKLQLLQQIGMEPNKNATTYYKLFHPYTGMCVHVDNENDIYANECQDSAKWIYKGEGTPIKLADSNKCLVATTNGQAVTLSDSCSDQHATWNLISGSKLHIASRVAPGNSLCLEWDRSNSNSIMTKKCLCVDGDDTDLPHCDDNPMKQWFKLVPSNTYV